MFSNKTIIKCVYIFLKTRLPSFLRGLVQTMVLTLFDAGVLLHEGQHLYLGPHWDVGEGARDEGVYLYILEHIKTL